MIIIKKAPHLKSTETYHYSKDKSITITKEVVILSSREATKYTATKGDACAKGFPSEVDAIKELTRKISSQTKIKVEVKTKNQVKTKVKTKQKKQLLIIKTKKTMAKIQTLESLKNDLKTAQENVLKPAVKKNKLIEKSLLLKIERLKEEIQARGGKAPKVEKAPKVAKPIVEKEPKVAKPTIEKAPKVEKPKVELPQNIFTNKIIEDFIQWMTDKGVYSSVFSEKNKATKELNSYITILNKNIFDVSKTNYNEVVGFLSNFRSNPEFMAFSAKRGKGTPAAVLGAKNYQAFLKNYFNK